MQEIDFGAPLPDDVSVTANLLAAWRARRQQRVADPMAYDSETWLGESLDGVRLGFATKDLGLTQQCLGETLSFASAMAAAGPLGSVAVQVTLHDAPELVCRFRQLNPCQWLPSIFAATLAGDTQTLAVLAAVEFGIATSTREGFALAAARAWLALAFRSPDAQGAIVDALRQAATDQERLLLSSLSAISNGTFSDAPALPPFETLAVYALALSVNVAEPSNEAMVGEFRTRGPQTIAIMPTLAAHHPREPHWWMSVHGLAADRSHHRLVTRDGHNVARYLIPITDTLSFVAEFLMTEQRLPSAIPFAFDPGQLLEISETFAASVNASPDGDLRRMRAQRAMLEDAIASLDELLLRLPAHAPVTEELFASPEGLARFRNAPGQFERERLERRRDAYVSVLNKIDLHLIDSASGTDSGIDRGAQAEDAGDARSRALAAIEVLKLQLTPLLETLARDRSGAALQAVKPHDDDFQKAFAGEFAEKARRAYAALWEPTLEMQYPDSTQTQLICDVAPAGMLLEDNELSRRFPGGYRAIAPMLNPHRIWVRWKFVRPGETAGMAYDGLVWLDDHWAWFPKPYRVLTH